MLTHCHGFVGHLSGPHDDPTGVTLGVHGALAAVVLSLDAPGCNAIGGGLPETTALVAGDEAFVDDVTLDGNNQSVAVGFDS